MTADPLNYGNEPGQGPLRPGGVSVSGDSLVNPEANLPSYKSKAAQSMAADLSLVRDVEGGQRRVKECQTVYLPKAPGEAYENYAERLSRSVFVNAFMQTVQGLTGYIFRRDPKLGDDVPAKFKADWENIDNAGTHGDVFARDVTQDAITAGHAAIFVEFPKTGGTQTSREEQTIRPYWIPVKKDNILSWRTENIDGKILLTQIVLKECTMVPLGSFGEVERELYRVLYRENGVVGFRLLQINKDRTVSEVDSGTYPTQDEIPLAEIVTSGKKSMFESSPPLVDLAHINITHYQVSSDYYDCIHKTNVPVWVQIGAEPPVDGQGNQVVIGPNSGLSLPMGGDAKWVAHDGAALDQTRLAISDLMAYMATIGLSMLSPDKRTAETAEGKRIDKSASDSKLGVTARGVQDALERAAGFHCRYYRLDSGGSIEVNKDFENLKMDAQMITALSGLVKEGQLSIETLWEMLSEGNTLPGTWDENTERAHIEAQREIDNAQAEVDFQRQQKLLASKNPTQNTQPLAA